MTVKTAVVWGHRAAGVSIGCCAPMWPGYAPTILFSDSRICTRFKRATFDHSHLSRLLDDPEPAGIDIARSTASRTLHDDGEWAVGDLSRSIPSDVREPAAAPLCPRGDDVAATASHRPR